MLVAFDKLTTATKRIERHKMSIQDFERKAFKEMLETGQLPKPLSKEHAKAARKARIRLKGDELLRKATLPSGWKVVQIKDIHGELHDSQGRVRGTVTYRGGPHPADVRGSLQMHRRYSHLGRTAEGYPCVKDTANGKILAVFKDSQDEQPAVDWLNQKFPKWQDRTAYWK